ncbi:long-chain-fatty-acid--CoA ligase [Vibrio sp.]|uniref:long-chain-fatty-acid--CoA ligase n=1 Tax=Vibrio sp. TaxID=678 RepID=UPI0031202B2C
MNKNMNLNNLFFDSVRRNKDSLVVYGDTNKYTYDCFKNRVAMLASSLKNLGVKEGDVVAIADWDSHRYLEMYFAIPMIGATLMTCNIRLSKEQRDYTLNHCDAKFFFINSDFLHEIPNSKTVYPNLVKYIKISDKDDDEYESFIALGDSCFGFSDIDENSIATLFYTSGTTGLPKGVSFTHRQLVLHTLALSSFLSSGYGPQRLHAGDVYLPMTPMFHVHAWGFPYVATMLGLKQVYAGKYSAKSLCHLIKEEGVTFTHSVPTLLAMLLDEMETSNVDLENLKVLVGGSQLKPSLMHRALDMGLDVWSGYGMSETGPVISISRLTPDQPEIKRCCAGQPIPFVDVAIKPEPDAIGKTPLVGEITVRAPWVTQGYYKDTQSTSMQWTDGRFHTGDVGYFTDDGTLVITDRKKDLIKSGGEWLSSSELESRALEVDVIKDVSFIAMHDDKWGERPVAFVVAKGDSNEKKVKQSLRSHFNFLVSEGKLSSFSHPDLVLMVESLPKTSVGKIDKKQLIQYLEKELHYEYKNC